MPLVRMKAAPVKTDGERLGNEFMNGVFFSAQLELQVDPESYFVGNLSLSAMYSATLEGHPPTPTDKLYEV